MHLQVRHLHHHLNFCNVRVGSSPTFQISDWLYSELANIPSEEIHPPALSPAPFLMAIEATLPTTSVPTVHQLPLLGSSYGTPRFSFGITSSTQIQVQEALTNLRLFCIHPFWDCLGDFHVFCNAVVTIKAHFCTHSLIRHITCCRHNTHTPPKKKRKANTDYSEKWDFPIMRKTVLSQMIGNILL